MVTFNENQKVNRHRDTVLQANKPTVINRQKFTDTGTKDYKSLDRMAVGLFSFRKLNKIDSQTNSEWPGTQ